MRDERFRRFRPFRDFARSRKAETALATRFFSRFRHFDGKSESAAGRIQGHPRRRLFGGLVNATPLTGARFFRDFEIPFSTKTQSRNLRVQSFGGARNSGRLRGELGPTGSPRIRIRRTISKSAKCRRAAEKARMPGPPGQRPATRHQTMAPTRRGPEKPPRGWLPPTVTFRRNLDISSNIELRGGIRPYELSQNPKTSNNLENP